MNIITLMRDPDSVPSPAPPEPPRSENDAAPSRSGLYKFNPRKADRKGVNAVQARRQDANRTQRNRRSVFHARHRPGLEDVEENPSQSGTAGNQASKVEANLSTMEKLRLYKEQKKKKKAEEAKKKRPPFKVGVYKLESQDIRLPVPKPAAPDSTKRNRVVKTPIKRKLRKTRAAASKDEENKTLEPPKRSRQTSVDQDSTNGAKSRRSTRIAAKRSLHFAPTDEIINSTVPENDVIALTSDDQEPARKQLKTPMKPMSATLSNTCLTPALASMQIYSQSDMSGSVTSTPLRRSARLSKRMSAKISADLDQSSQENNNPFNFSASMAAKPSLTFASGQDESGVFTFTAETAAAKGDETEFKTPTIPKRSRRSRMSTLVDCLSPSLCIQRGTSSDRRRIKKGQDTFVLFDQLDLDLPDDPSSPVHTKLSKLFKNQSTLAHEVDGKKTQPEVLDRKVNRILQAEKRRSSMMRESMKINFNQELQNLESEELGSQEHDVPYFRNILKAETTKLNDLCACWESKIDKVPEDIHGQVRSAIGKAKLIVNKKGRLEQFSELINNCEFNLGDKKTTCTDLQGFWDMINFQVEDILDNFKSLDKLEANSWQAEVEEESNENKKPNVVKKKKKPKTPAPKAKASKSLRALMAAKRQEMQKPDMPKTPILKVKEKVFDGGFFNVRSPLRKLDNRRTSTRKEGEENMDV